MICDRETRFGRIFQAAIDLNIVYKSKYLDMMYLEHNLYSHYVLKDYIEDIRKTMTARERHQFYMYKR